MNADREQTKQLYEGDTLSYTLEMLDGRTLILRLRMVKCRRTNVEVGISASLMVPQPSEMIRLVPDAG